ncbi:FxsA family protein [Proteiniborus sp.]|uniref:FxsA family protein n=1 Tax=Proteiniborus sp. TaxID=2079015 RepID=UPI00331E9C41
MLFKIFLLLTIVPIVEIFILFKIAEVTTVWTTIALVIVTGFVGAYLAKTEGVAILTSIKRELNEGRVPGNQLLNGLCVLIGGILLLTPGLLTDITGFTLVLPTTRQLYTNLIKRWLTSMIQTGSINVFFRR